MRLNAMPTEAAATLEIAIKHIMASPEMEDIVGALGFGLNQMSSAELGAFAVKSNTDFGAAMKAIGIAK